MIQFNHTDAHKRREIRKMSQMEIFSWRMFFILLASDMDDWSYNYTKYDHPFVVPHLDLFSLHINGAMFLFGCKMIGFLALIIAADIAYDLPLTILTVIYNCIYFSNMINSYQHEYLIGMILIIMTIGGSENRALAGRSSSAMIAIVYFYAAIAKWNDNGFLTGKILQKILPETEFPGNFISHVIHPFTESHQLTWSCLAHLTVFLEIFLSALFILDFLGWKPRTRCLRLLWLTLWTIGVTFHVTIHFSEVSIRCFSLYMLIFYLLILSSWLSPIKN